ncbi:MAG: hypothetical protein E7672_06715, partial [Ruminococcaceae bacterium]|nr:hypothetical protein [Oscillospiraceae bacterium]
MKNDSASNERKIKGGAIVRTKNPVKEFFGSFSSVRTKRLIMAAFAFIFAFVVAGTSVFPGTYPLGIAAVSAFSGITATISAFLGSIVGSARIPTVSGTYAAIFTILTAARILTTLYLSSDKLPDKQNKDRIFSSLRKFFSDLIRRRNMTESSGELLSILSRHSGIMLRENIVIRIALASCAALFAGAWSVVEGGYSYYDLIGAVFSLLFTPLATYVFYVTFERRCRYSPVRECAVYVLLACLTLSFSAMSSPTSMISQRFDLGVVFACIVSFVFSTQYGVHRGALASLACGLVLDPVYAPMYAISAVVCGTVSSISSGSITKILGVISGGVVCSAWAIYTSGIDGLVDIFPPVVASCALVSPMAAYGLIKMPETLFGGGLAALDLSRRASTSMDQAALSEMKGKITLMADGLHSVSAVLSGMAGRLSKPTPQEAREIVEGTFDTYCMSCRIREKCRHDGRTVERLEEKMIHQLTGGGVVSASVVPSSLASHCYNMGRILDDINFSFGQRVARMKEGDKLSVSAADYSLAGDLIEAVKGAVCEESEVDEELSRKLRRILSYNDFHATSVTVWGKRMKHIFVGDVDLSSTRMGGDDIRRLFEGIVGERLSTPEF